MDVDKLVGEMYNEMLKRCGIINRFTPGDLDIPEEDEYEETGIEYDPDVYRQRPELVGKGIMFERIRRCTGYLSGDYKTRFNNAKRAEVEDRTNSNKYTRTESYHKRGNKNDT